MKATEARNVSYGLIDSIISTTGVLVGLAQAGLDRQALVVTGIILVGVEATSMSFGAALSDEHYDIVEAGKTSWKRKWTSALVMFAAYALTGAVLIAPFALTENASRWSIGMAVVALFVLVGWFQGPSKASVATAVGLAIMALSMEAGKRLKV